MWLSGFLYHTVVCVARGFLYLYSSSRTVVCVARGLSLSLSHSSVWPYSSLCGSWLSLSQHHFTRSLCGSWLSLSPQLTLTVARGFLYHHSSLCGSWLSLSQLTSSLCGSWLSLTISELTAQLTTVARGFLYLHSLPLSYSSLCGLPLVAFSITTVVCVARGFLYHHSLPLYPYSSLCGSWLSLSPQ